MMNDLALRGTSLTIAVLLAGSAVAGSTQTAPPLRALTVPSAALPSGCAITPPPDPLQATPRGGTIVIHSTSLFPTNPWIGADRGIVAAIRAAVDGVRTRPLPDVPPEVVRDAAAERRWVENIREAYHAEYTAVGGSRVEVFAVTFTDAGLATAPEPLSAVLNWPRGPTRRIVRGATVIRVSASTSTACFDAVRAHVESLK
jgi:hypothetical protein